MASPPSLSSLPVDLLLDNVLPALETSSLLALSQASRSFNELISSDVFWKRRLAADFHFPVARTARETGYKALYRRISRPEVYTWGAGSNGRLGLPPDDPRLHVNPVTGGIDYPVRLRGPGPDGKGFVDLQAGGWSFHALDRSGKVWFWGQLDGTQWALPTEGPFARAAIVHEPTPLRFSDELPPIDQLSAGRSHAMALSGPRGYREHTGPQVFEWLAWGRLMHIVNPSWTAGPNPQHPIQVAAGWTVSTVLCSKGGVWCWWSDSFEQEVGTLVGERPGRPKLQLLRVDVGSRAVRCPDLPRTMRSAVGEEKIVKLAAGEDFLIALSSEAKVYRLDISSAPGQGDHASRLEAEILSGRRRWILLERYCDVEDISRLEPFQQEGDDGQALAKPSPDLRITHVSAAFRTFAVYSVTARDEESLVLLGDFDYRTPRVIPELQGRGVIDVCLGDWHSGALLASGQILVWGQHSSGALGLGQPPPGPDPPARPAPTRGRGILRRGRAFGYPPFGRARQPQNVDKPTAIPAFSGSASPDLCTSQGDGPDQRRTKKKFVFAASFAGWHSGCLAVSLEDDDEGEEQEEAVQDEQEEEERHDMPGSFQPEGSQDPPNRFRSAPGPSRIRIGFAGRGLRRGMAGPWMQTPSDQADAGGGPGSSG